MAVAISFTQLKFQVQPIKPKRRQCKQTNISSSVSTPVTTTAFAKQLRWFRFLWDFDVETRRANLIAIWVALLPSLSHSSALGSPCLTESLWGFEEPIFFRTVYHPS